MNTKTDPSLTLLAAVVVAGVIVALFSPMRANAGAAPVAAPVTVVAGR